MKNKKLYNSASERPIITKYDSLLTCSAKLQLQGAKLLFSEKS